MRLIPLLALSLLMSIMFIFACGGGDDEQSGTGWTGDVGEECFIVCYQEWCKNHKQLDCVSGYCVGQRDSYYCTVPCDLDNQCPAGYLCTEECTSGVAKVSICVTEEDYSFLQELAYCP